MSKEEQIEIEVDGKRYSATIVRTKNAYILTFSDTVRQLRQGFKTTFETPGRDECIQHARAYLTAELRASKKQ